MTPRMSRRGFCASLAAIPATRRFLRGWLSEAVQVHRAVPARALELEGTFTDDFAAPVHYYLRVRQYNGQWAWSSPVRFV